MKQKEPPRDEASPRDLLLEAAFTHFVQQAPTPAGDDPLLKKGHLWDVSTTECFPEALRVLGKEPEGALLPEATRELARSFQVWVGCRGPLGVVRSSERTKGRITS
jgi:hypothetical protein